MKLFCSTTSPYTRKVIVVLKELGLENQTEMIQVNPFQDPKILQQQNPLGKIPALITDSNKTFFDSKLICEYLIKKHSHPDNIALLPQAEDIYFQVQKTHFLADGIMDAAVARTIEIRRPEELRSIHAIQRHERAIKDSVTLLASSNLSKVLDISVIATICALDYLDFRFAEFDWRLEHQTLLNFYEQWKDRKSFTNSLPKE